LNPNGGFYEKQMRSAQGVVSSFKTREKATSAYEASKTNSIFAGVFLMIMIVTTVYIFWHLNVNPK
jgi:hypothetical protein